MINNPDRRQFMRSAAHASLGTLSASVLSSRVWGTAQAADSAPAPRLLFTSRGQTGIIHADGTGLRYFKLDVPNQATWQPAASFADHQRVLMLSMEPRRDGPGKPFDEYYTQTPTHLWSYHVDSGQLEELATRDRLAPFETPALLLGERMLVQVVRKQVGQIVSMRLDGSDPRDFTKPGEGLPYGLSLSPDGKRVAFHLASPQGYQVWTSDTLGNDRVKIAADPSHLYFGPTWSPDGQWLAFYDCLYQQDHAHDWADVCVAHPDGTELRSLTTGQACWFGATYGDQKSRGGGSNIPAWSSDGGVVVPRRSPGARVPWLYRAGQADVDHFNREFKPEQAVGGTRIVRLDPRDGSERGLTMAESTTWDFRATPAADGKLLAFCRAATGGAPGLWVANADGTNPRLLTRGVDDLGADHPRWL